MESVELKFVCRVCLTSKENMESIYNLDKTSTTVPYFYKIIQCTNIEICENELCPDQICSSCIDDLETAYKFRLNVEASEAILSNIDSTVECGNYEMKEETKDTESIKDHNYVISSEDVEEHDVDSVDGIYKDESEIVLVQETSKRSTRRRTQELKDQKSEMSTLLTIPKRHEGEKPPKIKGIVTKQNPDGSVKTLVRLTRSSEPSQGKRQNSDEETDQLVCYICGASFNKKHAMRAHINRHNKEKTNVCQVCSKAFALPIELKRHMRRHTGEKPYPCRHCPKSFSDFGTRVKHERIHTGDRPYQCSYCSKTFTYGNVLKFHMMVHTGEKPYACTECDKRFIKSHQLKSHLATHGLGTPRKRKLKPIRPAKNLEVIISIIEESEVGESEIADLSSTAMVIQIVQAE